MHYFQEILRILTWPAVILISYFISRLVLKRIDSILPDKDDDVA